MNYNWNLKDSIFTKDKGTVFSCFSCGGGSTMGYKLAGFDVIGCNEIDSKLMDCYILNHNPKYPYCEPIQDFKKRNDLPSELFNLDILDGSPPCSSFTPNGNREKDWGKSKKFREGQKEQILDTLFFDFIDLAEKLQPKVVVAENVKGLLQGASIKYVRKIYNAFDKAGYYCQHFLLNAVNMGVPQERERVFFICLRRDISDKLLYQADLFSKFPYIEMNFKEKPIVFAQIKTNEIQYPLNDTFLKYLSYAKPTDPDMRKASKRMKGKESLFSYRFVHDDKPLWTLTSNKRLVVYNEKRYLNDLEVIRGGSFPNDYNFNGCSIDYIVGMSVPPIMMAKIALQIYEQWLSKL